MRQSILWKSLLFAMLCTHTLLADIVADAQNGTTQYWTAIRQSTVTNVQDGNNRAYKIDGFAVFGKYWKYGTALSGTEHASTVSVDIKTTKTYTLWIHVRTNIGLKQILIYPSYANHIRAGYNNNITYTLDRSSVTGTWHTLIFDLQEIFDTAGIHASVEGVEGISARSDRHTNGLLIDNMIIENRDNTTPVPPDTAPPVITLNGLSRIHLTAGDTYTEEGAVATDNVDGNVTVDIRGHVDTYTTGIYTLTYIAIDNAGNRAAATRTIEVKAPEPTTPPTTSQNSTTLHGITYRHTNQTSSMGTNTGAGYPYVDLMKSASRYSLHDLPSHHPSGAVEFDVHRNVRNTHGHNVVSYFIHSLQPGDLPDGNYIVLYDGKGRLSYGGATLVDSQPGRDIIAIHAPTDGHIANVWLSIQQSDPQDYLRNVRILLPGGICSNDPYHRVNDASACTEGSYLSFEAHYQDIVFNPAYLNYMKDFNTIRFMDAMGTNNSLIKEWEDRPKPSDAQWSIYHYKHFTEDMLQDTSKYGLHECVSRPGTPLELRCGYKDSHGNIHSYIGDKGVIGGMPVEIMVDLCNRLHINPWFNMPHRASDSYVRHFATYVRDHLDPALKTYIEYSNEIWGSGLFTQGTYAAIKGYERYSGQSDPYGNWNYHRKFIALRPVEIFDIWEDVFGSTQRFVRVLGAQAVLATTMSNGSGNGLLDILVKNNKIDKIDAIALGWYFVGGLSEGLLYGTPDAEPYVTPWGKKIQYYRYDPSLTKEDILSNLASYVQRGFGIIRDPKRTDIVIKWLQDHKKIADRYNIDVIAYEGGQHLVAPSRFVDYRTTPPTRRPWDNMQTGDAITDIYHAMNKDVQMGEYYTEMFHAWKDNGGKLFVHFTAPNHWGWWGSWGLKTGLEAPTLPKYEAVKSFMRNTPRWWK